MLLQGKTAVISRAAGARGIGLATAKLFASHGARVAILDLDAEASKAAAASLGEGHLGLACDVADRGACDQAVEAALGAFGQVDILINNAENWSGEGDGYRCGAMEAHHGRQPRGCCISARP